MTNVISISEARANFPELVSTISEKLDRAVITVNGKPRAVMISLEELESIEETAEILAVPGSLESIKKGMKQAKKGEGTPLSELLK